MSNGWQHSPAREALPAVLFSAAGGAEEEYDDFGEFRGAAPEPPGGSTHAQAQKLSASGGTGGGAAFRKGQAVWLHDRRQGAWVEAKVVHVDLSLHPPSYGVELPGGAFRETEQDRLRPREPGTPPPGGAGGAAAGQAVHAANGHAAGASVPALPAPAPAVPAAQLAPKPKPAAAGWAQPQPASPSRAAQLSSRQHSGPGLPPSTVRNFRSYLQHAASEEAPVAASEAAGAAVSAAQQAQQQQPQPPVHPGSHAAGATVAAGWQQQQGAAEEEEADDFGDFAEADGAPSPAVQQQPLPVSAATGPSAASPPAAPPAAPQPPPPPPPAVPMGVRRDAPLPLDLFGEEEQEEEAEEPGLRGPVQGPAPLGAAAAWGAQPGMQPAAAAAPSADQQHQAAANGVAAAPAVAPAEGWGSEEDDFADFQQAGEQAASPAQALPPAAPAVVAAGMPSHPPSTVTTPNGRMLAADYPQQFVRQAPVTIAAAEEVEDAEGPGSSAAGTPETSDALAAATEAAEVAEAALPAAAAAAGAAEAGETIVAAGGWPGMAAPAAAENGFGSGWGDEDEFAVWSTASAGTMAASAAAGDDAVLTAALTAAQADVSAASQPQEQQQEEPQPGSPAPQQSSKPSALLSVLHPVAAPAPGSPASARLAASLPAGLAAASSVGAELVTEYAVAWTRLLKAAATQLQASADVWAEAGRQGCWQEFAALPATQQHLAACAQLYAAAVLVRVAAQQLGLLSLVPELQEGWSRVEAAWTSLPSPPAAAEAAADSAAGTGSPADGQAEVAQGGWEEGKAEDGVGDGGEAKTDGAAASGQQPPFREAVAAACACLDAAGGAGEDGGDGDVSSDAVQPLRLLTAAEGAPAALGGMSLDDFPRLLSWSEGLCGLTLLPLSLFEGCAPVAPWAEGRPCLVPLANLWLHRVSSAPPQLD